MNSNKRKNRNFAMKQAKCQLTSQRTKKNDSCEDNFSKGKWPYKELENISMKKMKLI